MEIQIPNSEKQLVTEVISPNLIRISIRNKQKIVKIGTINKAEREIVIFRNRAQHQHIRTSSYGFNEFLMTKSAMIDRIKIIEDNDGYSNTYSISRRSVLDVGTIMNFIDEVQIFVPISYLERFCKL